MSERSTSRSRPWRPTGLTAGLLGGMVTAALAGACAAPQGGLSAERRQTLVMGVPAPPESPNPYLTTSTLGLWLGDILFLRLGREQKDFARHPPSFTASLAERWETSPDGREIVFHLDPRARWSDGEPITSDDVVYTWRVQIDPAVAWAGRPAKQEIEAVEALDERRVRFRFRRPSPYALMDAIEGNILPAHRLRALATDQWDRVDWAERLVYSGPFVLERWNPQQSIVLRANPRYLVAGRPKLERLELRVIPDEAARTAQLVAGEIDFVDDLASEEFARACSQPRLRCEAAPDLYYAYIGWNTSRAPFGDARLRRALGLAIDRQEMVAQVLGGAGRPAAGPILSLFWVHDPRLEPLAHDPAEARRLLQEAGFRDRDGDGILERGGRPLRFDLDVPHGAPLRERIAVRVRSDLEQVGARVDILPLERALFTERHRRGDFDAYISAWAPATRIDLTPQFHSVSIGNSFNYVRLADRDLDALLERARSAQDLGSLLEAWRAVERRVVDLQPYAFLFEKDRLLAIDRRFHGAAFDLRGPLATVEEWEAERAP